MRRTGTLLACALTIVAALAPPAPAATGAAKKAIGELNQIRRAHGLQALRSSGSLSRSSRRYAREMLRRDYFGHEARIHVAHQFDFAGETLAWHSGLSAQPRRTVRDWMRSPPHRAVLLSPQFHWAGMGLARGRLDGRVVTAWVAHVGAR